MKNQPVRKERVFFEKVGDRRIAVRGYCVDALLRHLQEHNDKFLEERKRLERFKDNDSEGIRRKCYEATWCTPACLAKTFNEHNSKESRQKARTRFSSGYVRLLTRYGMLLLKQHETHSGALARAKLYDPSFPEDKAHASQQLDEAIKNGDEKQSRLEAFARIIGTDYRPDNPEPEPPGAAPSAEASL
jgi:hypothetical protein